MGRYSTPKKRVFGSSNNLLKKSFKVVEPRKAKAAASELRGVAPAPDGWADTAPCEEAERCLSLCGWSVSLRSPL